MSSLSRTIVLMASAFAFPAISPGLPQSPASPLGISVTLKIASLMYCVSSSIFFMHCITLSMVYWLFSSDMFSIFSVLILSSILYPSVSVYSCASSEGRSVILFSSVNRALPFLTRPFARFSYVLPIIFPLESTTSIFSEAGEVLFVMGTLPY